MAAKVKTIKVAKMWGDKQWTVRFGRLNPGPGRPETIQSLFKVVAEKIPFEALNAVNRYLRDNNIRRNGVYLAHDSMGYARYIGRGRIFPRLRARLKSQILELKYFSFYVVWEMWPGMQSRLPSRKTSGAPSLLHGATEAIPGFRGHRSLPAPMFQREMPYFWRISERNSADGRVRPALTSS